MPSGTVTKVRPKRAKSKSRNRRKNKKSQNQSAGFHSEPSSGEAASAKYVGATDLCPVCLNVGLFIAVRTLDSPALVRYCECAHGTEMLAIMLEQSLGFVVPAADRFSATRYATFR